MEFFRCHFILRDGWVIGRIVLAVAVSFLYGCTPAEVPVKKEQKVAEVPDRLVARVASIYLKENYVLIQRYGRLDISEDAILYSQGADGASANLKVTGEKLGQFIAADILSGKLAIGDAVYLRIVENGENSEAKGFLDSD